MKVIVASYPKTGTKSLNAALKLLGYSVYDYFENIYLLEDEYKKIFNEGWTKEDFQKMYENVDAILDVPALYFWEEIHKAFPDAKIILSVRESEEDWYRSFRKQVDVVHKNFLFRIMLLLSITNRRLAKQITGPMAYIVFGILPHSIFRLNIKLNKQMMILRYRAHNAYVMQNAPSDKLLVYHCREGWKPLCDFLEVPVPEEPFPHKNIRGSFIEDAVKTHPIVKRLVFEAMVSSSVLVATVAVSCYYMYRKGPRKLLGSAITVMTSTLGKIKLIM